jgi:hypothetical protein
MIFLGNPKNLENKNGCIKSHENGLKHNKSEKSRNSRSACISPKVTACSEPTFFVRTLIPIFPSPIEERLHQSEGHHPTTDGILPEVRGYNP